MAALRCASSREARGGLRRWDAIVLSSSSIHCVTADGAAASARTSAAGTATDTPSATTTKSTARFIDP
jgi:hypothetical protein